MCKPGGHTCRSGGSILCALAIAEQISNLREGEIWEKRLVQAIVEMLHILQYRPSTGKLLVVITNHCCCSWNDCTTNGWWNLELTLLDQAPQTTMPT